VIPCTRCQTPLPATAINTLELTPCAACGTAIRADVYPALCQETQNGHAGSRLQDARAASCFYHPEKQALLPCSVCGRFMCALCDIDLNGRHLCPVCFEKGKTHEKITDLVARRVCYDRIALLVAVLPIMMVWITIVTAPVAIFLAVRYWNAPASILPRTKARSISAILIASAQIAIWGTVLLT